MMQLVKTHNKISNGDFNRKNNMENKNIEILYNMWAEKAQHLTMYQKQQPALVVN